MKAIEKALLIKELHQLIDGLEHQPLSFFEIARSKKRIREIFALCDEPIFQKQLEAYKALTQPQAAAERWIQQSPYQHVYIGLFQYESGGTVDARAGALGVLPLFEDLPQLVAGVAPVDL